MKITKVIMINFMSHIFSEIDLKDFFVIKGLNDSGKSTILHAIRWVFLNQPKGNHIINNKHDFCSVEIYYELFGKNHILKKIRNGNNTEFEFNGKKYYKSDFPLEAINPFEDISFNENKINLNFTFQHDPYFMLNATSELNNAIINHMQNVDPIIKEIIKDIREEKKNHEILSKLIKINEEKLEILKEEKEKEENIINNISIIEKSIYDITRIIELLYILDKYNIDRIEIKEHFDNEFIDFDELELRCIHTIEVYKHKLINIIEYDKLVNYDLKTIDIKKYKDFNYIDFDRICTIQKELLETYQKYEKLLKEIEQTQNEIDSFEVCPLCNRPF